MSLQHKNSPRVREALSTHHPGLPRRHNPMMPILFSVKTLRIMTFTGFLVSFAGLVTAAVFVMKRLIGVEQAQKGFTTLVTLILVLGGMNLVATGLLGEYLSRVCDEAKRRPIYIVKSVHGIGGGAPYAKGPM